MTDQELEERLHKLVKADILADVVTNPQEGPTLDRFITIQKVRFYDVDVTFCVRKSLTYEMSGT